MITLSDIQAARARIADERPDAADRDTAEYLAVAARK